MGVALTRVEVARGFEPVLNFDVGRVRAIFEDFEEACPAPVLWEMAFGELLDCFDAEEDRARAFAAVDTNGDGLVDAREVLGALAILCQGHLRDRMALLFDIFDFNKERQMVFDEAFLMVRRTIVGLRKLTGIAVPPEKVMHSMTRQIFRVAKAHTSQSLTPEEWTAWWSTDAAVRNTLKMFVSKAEDTHGLPTPDTFVWKDYAQGAKEGEEDLGAAAAAAVATARTSQQATASTRSVMRHLDKLEREERMEASTRRRGTVETGYVGGAGPAGAARPPEGAPLRIRSAQQRLMTPSASTATVNTTVSIGP